MRKPDLLPPAYGRTLDRFGAILGIPRTKRWGIIRESDKKYRARMVNFLTVGCYDGQRDIEPVINKDHPNQPVRVGQVAGDLVRRWFIRALLGTGEAVIGQSTKGINGGGVGSSTGTESD